MQAVVRPPQPGEGEPVVLLENALDRRRRSAWAVSVALHAATISVLLLMPQNLADQGRIDATVRHVTPLVAPPTQRAPNRGALSKEFSVEGLLPSPPVRVPAAVPPMNAGADARPPVPRPAPPRPAPTRTLPDAPTFEPPKTELAQAAPPGPRMPGAPAPPPPQIETQEKPKIAFEAPSRPGSGTTVPGGSGLGRLPMPSSSVSEAARAAMSQGVGGTAVGDVDLPGSGGLGGGLNLPGRAPRDTSTVEMLSDPQGVDFKPYLIRVLAAVRRNWRSVIPESARLGRQGRVQIQFAIARDGSVPKLVIALPSGTDALDRAAVAGISASNPFPPLPNTFKGEQVRLQLTFSYNMK
ncbi:MAG TPA: TonB family protein [Bryobacteraceae bacterium]|nr:TonB family protein [Bryobacteraceae bacterium]